MQIPRSFSSEGQSLTRHMDQSEESILSTNPSSPDQADRAGAGLAVVLLEGPHAGAEHGVHGGAGAVGGLGPEGGPAQLLPCQHAAPRPLLEPVT